MLINICARRARGMQPERYNVLAIITETCETTDQLAKEVTAAIGDLMPHPKFIWSDAIALNDVADTRTDLWKYLRVCVFHQNQTGLPVDTSGSLPI